MKKTLIVLAALAIVLALTVDAATPKKTTKLAPKKAPAAPKAQKTVSKPPAKKTETKAKATSKKTTAKKETATKKPDSAPIQKLKTSADKAAKKIVDQAKEKANAIKNGCTHCKKPPTPKDAKAEAKQYLAVEYPDAAPLKSANLKSIGVHPGLSIDPKVIAEAKTAELKIKGFHRRFVKKHEKDCQGTLCPLSADGGKVNADVIPGF